MKRNQGARIVGGILLILVGLYLLLVQFFPHMRLLETVSWPLIIVGAGVLMLIIGLLAGNPGMAVPAATIGGIGLILYYQNETGDWASWSYAWALIPGFAGVGSIIAGILGDNPRKSFREGINLIITSGALFLMASSIFGGPITLGDYWPVLLILLGFWTLVSYFLGGRKSRDDSITSSGDQA